MGQLRVIVISQDIVERSRRGPVRVDVTWNLSPYRLEIKVVNSIGCGRVPGVGGMGLRNVRERLAVQFAGRAVLSSGLADPTTWVATLHLQVLREWKPAAAAATAVATAAGRP